MKLQILDKHHLFQARYAVQEMVNSSFKNTHLKHFTYGKFYKNGAVNLLSTCPKIFQHCLRMNYQFTTPVPQSFISHEFYYLLQQEGVYEKVLADCINLFSLYNPLDIFIVKENYYEMFCFGFNRAVADPLNFYMNNLDYLKKFCLFFKRQSLGLVQSGEYHLIHLPPNLRSNILTECRVLKNNPPLKNNGVLSSDVSVDGQDLFQTLNNKLEQTMCRQGFSFSRRESECLKFLSQGYSHKQIASELNISIRTVEYYINIAKQKAHCKKQTELIAKYLGSVSDGII